MRWRDKDIAELKDKWGNSWYSMKDLCEIFSTSQSALMHVAKTNGLPSRSQLMRQQKARKGEQLKKIAGTVRYSKGDLDPKEVARKLKEVHERNAKKMNKASKNNKVTWQSDNRSCYKRTLCQWPETFDDNHIHLCGASALGSGPYCKFHTNFTTQRSMTKIGTADVDYLEAWWEQTF